MLYIFCLLRHKRVFLVICVFLNRFSKQEMRYCFDDAPRTGERNVNLNKINTSENVASNKIYLVGWAAGIFTAFDIEPTWLSQLFHTRSRATETSSLSKTNLALQGPLSRCLNHKCKAVETLWKQFRFWQ